MPIRGRLSREDVATIKANAGVLSPAEIANRIDRTVECVENYIAMNVKPAETAAPPPAEEAEKVTIRQEMRATENWRTLRDEFTAKELSFFEERYVLLMTQYKGAVLPTEETQLLQSIKFEILMSRNMVGRKRALEDIVRLEKMQADFLEPFDGKVSNMSEEQRATSIMLDQQLQQARSAEASKTTEFTKLQERHASLMSSLKSTRDQRLDKIEKEGVDFIGVLRQLSQRDVQEREGRSMELMKLAARKELERLGRPHTYDDKSQDSPILCEDTVDLGPAEAVDASCIEGESQ